MPFPMGKEETEKKPKISQCLPSYASSSSFPDDVMYSRFLKPVRLDVKLKPAPKFGEAETKKS